MERGLSDTLETLFFRRPITPWGWSYLLPGRSVTRAYGVASLGPAVEKCQQWREVLSI